MNGYIKNIEKLTHHRDSVIHTTKAETDADTEHFEGKTTI